MTTDGIQFTHASLINPLAHEQSSAACRDLLHRVLGDQAFTFEVARTGHGDVGMIMIPVFGRDLFADRDATVAAVLEGISVAVDHGAQVVSCTGMIPAATRGLLAVQAALDRSDFASRYPDLRLTTGHETVTAAFVMNIEQICRVSGRDFDSESVAFVGLGHIGMAVVDLLFRIGRRPRAIRLVDIEAKAAALHHLRTRLVDDHGYRGDIDVVTVPRDAALPTDIYGDTGLFITATSAPDVVDIDRLRPGAMIVDDSVPLAFDVGKARARIERQRDILITIAGALASDTDITSIHSRDTGVPGLDHGLAQIRAAAHAHSDSMTGCVYSAVLVDHFDLPYTLGKVESDHALAHYQRLSAHGFRGTSIYVFDFRPGQRGVHLVDRAVVDHFREHHGGHVR